MEAYGSGFGWEGSQIKLSRQANGLYSEVHMNSKNGFWAFVFGGLVGAAVALLYAPQPGEKTRKILINNGEIFKDKAVNSLHEAQARMDNFTVESKKRLEKLQEIGEHTLEEEKKTLKAGLRQAKEAVTGNGNRNMSGETYS